MAKFERKTFSAVEEKRIVTGLIVSTELQEKISKLIKPEYFKNSYLRILADWSIVFFETYQKAPFKHIKDIFEQESQRLKDAEVEMIEILLKDLDNQYETGADFNVDYIKGIAIDYFRKRELEIHVNNVAALVDRDDYEEAEELVQNFVKVRSTLGTQHIINLGDIEHLEEIYRKKELEQTRFFKMPGDLGKYLGPHKRGDVVGFYAPAKRGKSWVLINYLKNAIIAKRKTIFWSIEMTDSEVASRVMKSFVPMVDGEEGLYTYPAFDCEKNQTGSCKFRESSVIVREGDEIIEDPAHKTCIKCRNHEQHKKKYKWSTYAMEAFRDQDDIFSLRKYHSKYEKLFRRYGRISVHPKYTLTYDKMMMDIDEMYQNSGFIPDILLIDYIDILGIDSRHDDFRLEDERWKLLAKLAGETNTLVVTVTQANKAGHSTENLDSTHQGGFYGKNRHVNLMVGLNQKPEEKEVGVMRFGITEARSMPFIQGKSCIVLQDLASGQAYLDSYYDF